MDDEEQDEAPPIGQSQKSGSRTTVWSHDPDNKLSLVITLQNSPVNELSKLNTEKPCKEKVPNKTKIDYSEA